MAGLDVLACTRGMPNSGMIPRTVFFFFCCVGAAEIGRLHREWLGYDVFLFSRCSLADALFVLHGEWHVDVTVTPSHRACAFGLCSNKPLCDVALLR